MVYIDGVRFGTDYSGRRVIAELRWTNTFNATGTNTCTKREMINFINANPNSAKTKYYRYGSWHVGEDVRVVDNAYLRTDANNIKADNLGELPEF